MSEQMIFVEKVILMGMFHAFRCDLSSKIFGQSQRRIGNGFVFTVFGDALHKAAIQLDAATDQARILSRLTA